MPNVSTAQASDICKLEHPLWDSARTVDMVTGLVYSFLLITRKLASVGYITVYNRKEVNIYNGHTTKIIVSEEALLKGWRCPRSTLCHIPLTSQVKNLNTDSLLLNSSNGHPLSQRNVRGTAYGCND